MVQLKKNYEGDTVLFQKKQFMEYASGSDEALAHGRTIGYNFKS